MAGAAAPWFLTGALVVAVGLWLLIVDRLRGVAQSSLLKHNAPPGRAPALHWIDSAALPLLFALRATSFVAFGWPTALVYGTVAAMCLVMVWRHPIGAPRDASAFAFMFGAVAVFIALSPDVLVVRVAGFLMLTLIALALHRTRPSVSWVVVGVALLATAASLTLQGQLDRPVYAFTPFATAATLAAIMVTATFAIIARFWRVLFEATCISLGHRPRRTYANGLRLLLDVTMAAPWVWTFVWVLIELSMAHSPSTSTLLLVTYFAATAVASVAVGRMRNSAPLRRKGLGLALAAATTSVYGASTYFGIGIRIVAYLVTSAFLLGIAFWYRRPGPATATT